MYVVTHIVLGCAQSQPERVALQSASPGLDSAWVSAMPIMPTLSDYAVTFGLRTRLPQHGQAPLLQL
jgi:hypothetical protein